MARRIGWGQGLARIHPRQQKVRCSTLHRDPNTTPERGQEEVVLALEADRAAVREEGEERGAGEAVEGASQELRP